MSAFTVDNAMMARMVADALEFCAEKTGLKDSQAVRDVLLKGDCCVCEYLRYALAQGIAAYLGSVDDSIQAIYTYEPDQATRVDEAIPGRPNLSPGVNLIARVSRKSASLSPVLRSLRSALAEEYKKLGCPKANALCSEIDLRAVVDYEVEQRTGHGALLSSLYVRPIEVWHR